MSEKTFILTVDSESVGRLTIDMPGSSANILSRSVMKELDQMLGELAARSDIRALVIGSAKKGIFIAGADISEIEGLVDAEDAADMAAEGQAVFTKLAALPYPTIAMIDGACMGGGCEFALACTYRVASDHAKTRFSLPEVQLGILPGFGGTQRLPRLVGLIAGLEMILSGRQWDGKKSLKRHLVDACYPHDFLEDYTQRFVRETLADGGATKVIRRRRRKGIQPLLLESNGLGRALIFRKTHLSLKKTTRNQVAAYPALSATVNVLRETARCSIDVGLRKEAVALGELAITPECKTLIGLYHIKTAIEKDSGVLVAVDPVPVTKTAVIGAGVMGGGIAWLFSYRGLSVRMKDIAWPAIASGYQQAAAYYGQLRRSRRIDNREIDVCMARISSGVSFVGFGDQDLVVEAVVENMSVKKSVLAELENEIGSEALIATNTSALSVTEMGSALKRPERFIGLHFFNPVNRMPLVEIIPGEKTSPRTVASLVAFAKKMRKTPIVVKDVPGFLVNRVLMPYMNEACRLFEEGAFVERVDEALVGFGMPMGPFRLADEVGIDVAFKVASTLQEAYGERMTLSGLLSAMYEDDHLLGKKGGKGFYLYLSGKTKPVVNDQLDKRVEAVLKKVGSRRRHPPEDEILDRTLLMLVNEAARCIEEGVVEEPGYLDMAMLMGVGFPPFHGGPLRYADQRGIGRVVKRLEEFARDLGPRFTPAAILVDMAESNRRFYEPTAAAYVESSESDSL